MTTTHRLAIVTGTSSGIGLALAEALLAAGWRVQGIARREAPLDHPFYTHLAADLAGGDDLTGRVLPHLRSLLTDPAIGRVALVNNAAVIGELCWVRHLDPHRLARSFAVNAQAPLVLMSLAAEVVPEGVPLRIVNISSGAAHSPFPGLADYSATKAALRLAGQTLAAEFEREGRTRDAAAVLSYEPGLVATAMQDQARAADPERFPAQTAFRDFHAQNLLHAPAAVVGEIVAFVDSAPDAWFTERRFAGE